MIGQRVADRGFAHLTEQLSHYCNKHPSGRLSQFVMGGIPTAWNLTGTSRAEIRGWRTVDGVASSGGRPATYTHAVVFQADREGMIAALNEDRQSRRVAAAYCIGDNIMAAAVVDIGRTLRQEEASEPDVLQIGLRVGRGAMDATIGVYDVTTNRFRNTGADVDLMCEPEPIAEIQQRFPGAILL